MLLSKLKLVATYLAVVAVSAAPSVPQRSVLVSVHIQFTPVLVAELR